MQNKLKEIISQGEMWVYLIEIWLGKTFFFLAKSWQMVESNQIKWLNFIYIFFFVSFACEE